DILEPLEAALRDAHRLVIGLRLADDDSLQDLERMTVRAHEVLEELDLIAGHWRRPPASSFILSRFLGRLPICVNFAGQMPSRRGRMKTGLVVDRRSVSASTQAGDLPGVSVLDVAELGAGR